MAFTIESDVSEVSSESEIPTSLALCSARNDLSVAPSACAILVVRVGKVAQSCRGRELHGEIRIDKVGVSRQTAVNIKSSHMY